MESAPRQRATVADRACLAAAFALTIAWFFAYRHFRTDFLVDESGHLGNIYHFLEGRPGWPEAMTMLPGYHFIVAGLWQLHPPITLLSLARLVSTVTAVLGLAAFAGAWQRLHRAPPGRATLLLALLPMLQPFTALAYTDIPALAFVLIAFSAQQAGHRMLAAGLFLAAVALRQTNLLWAAFAIAWEWFRIDLPRAQFFRRTQALWLLLLGAIAVACFFGRITVGRETGTEARPNIATLHTAAWLALLLGFPVWCREFARVCRARSRPRLLGVAASIIAIVVLVLTFENPHPWNRELFWEGHPFTLLRNWPLVWTEPRLWLKIVSAINVVAMTLALGSALTDQPHRRALLLALAFGAALPASVNLVEPRYFVSGAAFALLFLRLQPATWKRLVLWWALLCVVHAPFIAAGRSLW